MARQPLLLLLSVAHVVFASIASALEELPPALPPSPLLPHTLLPGGMLSTLLSGPEHAFSTRGFGNILFDVAPLHGATSPARAGRVTNTTLTHLNLNSTSCFAVQRLRCADLVYSPTGAQAATLALPRSNAYKRHGADDGWKRERVQVEREGEVADYVHVSPYLGYVAAVDVSETACDTGVQVARHGVVVQGGVEDELVVLAHTHSRSRSVAVEVDATTRVQPGAEFRFMSFNVWNLNPPKWLFRDPRDRFRQYSLRMLHMMDVVREYSPDIVAFQEVRYDSHMGGYDDPRHAEDPYPPPSRAATYTFRIALLTACDWYNRTRKFSVTDRYVERNAGKWAAVKGAAKFADSVAQHAGEGLHGTYHACAVNDTAQQGEDVTTLPSPYRRNTCQKAAGSESIPDDFSRIQRMMLESPHAQIVHLAAQLPGYTYVHTPAHMYMDAGEWTQSPHVDTEGPAIFSRYPILSSDYFLLSRDPTDEGDGHTRLCIHAVIDVAGASVDVYTVHLALSERARNRTIPELLAFIRATAVGQVTILAGDMNAEPHEPALALLREHGVHYVPSAPRVTVDENIDAASAEAAAAAAQAAAEQDWTQFRAAALDQARQLVVHPTLPPTDSDIPVLQDAWLAAHDEPTPRDGDAALRRYAFTFPSDDPVKRIDIAFLGAAEGAVCAHGEAGDACGVRLKRTFLVGQDPLPATDANEGKGLGMTHEMSPIYASDHRALVLDLVL